MPELPRMTGSLDEIAGGYSVLLCDVWGVVHNGERAFTEASAALARARENGKAVILITNAPRPHPDVEAQLRALGVPSDAYDRVVTSRDLIADGPRMVFHIGPDRDLSIYDGLDIELCEEPEASVVVCTGLFDDETETPEDYSDLLRRLRARNLPFICANPDIVVERGDRLIWCAGALARDFGQLGGRRRAHRYQGSLAERHRRALRVGRHPCARLWRDAGAGPAAAGGVPPKARPRTRRRHPAVAVSGRPMPPRGR